MSLINEYRSTEAAITELQERLAKLKNDPRLQKDIEFEEKLRQLMGEYSKSLRDIQLILDPQIGRTTEPRKERRERTVKVYINPNTGEQVETKGGNHKILKAWKAEHGSDVVESWLQNS
ncbi:H-NS histone [Pseudomonas aeruginosa]|nr:H-NS histone [Pseudomonas aeruginosa]